MDILTTAPSYNPHTRQLLTSAPPPPEIYIVVHISTTWKWLTHLCIKDSELEYSIHVLLPLPEIPFLTPMTIHTFTKQKAETQDNKEKREDNRNKISAAGEQMDMVIHLAGPRKWEPKSAMEKAKGKTSIMDPCPRRLRKLIGSDTAAKKCKCGAKDRRVSGTIISQS